MKHRLLLLPAVVLASLPLVARPAAAQTEASLQTASTLPDDENTRVRDLFRQSRATFKAGNAELARQQLLEAWSIRQTYDVASSLGQVEVAMKRYADAAGHLYYSLQHFAPIESEQTLDQVKKAYADVRQRVAMLHISVDQPGATVLVDDTNAGVAPLASPVFVEPGAHSIQARHGSDVVTRTISAEPNQELSADLTFGASSAANPSLPPATSTTPPTYEDATGHGGKSIVPIIVGGSLFAVGIGLGIGFRLAGDANLDHAHALQANIPPSGCAARPSSSDCAAIRDAANAKDRNYDISTASFVVAGVAGVATAAYWLFWPNRHPTAGSSSTFRVGGGISPNGGLVWVGDRF